LIDKANSCRLLSEIVEEPADEDDLEEDMIVSALRE